jgi:DNA-binding NtrC family response regulator
MTENGSSHEILDTAKSHDSQESNPKQNRESEEQGSLRAARAAFESRFIADIIRRNAGNLSQAARVMGISRVQLQRKVKDYGLR